MQLHKVNFYANGVHKKKNIPNFQYSVFHPLYCYCSLLLTWFVFVCLLIVLHLVLVPKHAFALNLL